LRALTIHTGSVGEAVHVEDRLAARGRQHRHLPPGAGGSERGVAVARFSSVTKFITSDRVGAAGRGHSLISDASSPPEPPMKTASGSGHWSRPSGALPSVSV